MIEAFDPLRGISMLRLGAVASAWRQMGDPRIASRKLECDKDSCPLADNGRRSDQLFDKAHRTPEPL